MEHVPQIDGMEDFDSEDDHGEAAESVPVNEGVDLEAGEAPAVEDVAAEDINQPEEVVGAQCEAAEEFSLPETTEQHEVDVMESVAMEASEVVGVGNIYTEEVPQEFSAEEINHLDSGNLPTEVSLGQDLEQLEQMVPTEMGDLIDNNEYLADGAGENSTDNIVDGDVDTLDNQGNGERYEDEQVEMDDYAQSEDFNEDEEEYNSDVYDEDSREQQRGYEEDLYRSQYQPPPEKKARMTSDDEVTLDSDDEKEVATVSNKKTAEVEQNSETLDDEVSICELEDDCRKVFVTRRSLIQHQKEDHGYDRRVVFSKTVFYNDNSVGHLCGGPRATISLR